MIKSDSEFLHHAMKNYDNPSLTSIEEFQEDLKKFVSIISLTGKYKSEKATNERLLLNYVIVIFNVFGDGAIDMFYYRIPEDSWFVIETYMFFLKRIDKVRTKIDFPILQKLQKL